MSFSTLFYNNATTGNKDYRCLDVDLNLSYEINNVLDYPYGIAVNNIDDCFYVIESGTIKRRLLSTGAQTHSASSGTIRSPFIVDAEGNVWCTNDAAGPPFQQKISKFAADLSSSTVYTRKSANGIPSYYKARLCADGVHIIVLGYSNDYNVACFDIADLNGGDPIWSTVTGFYVDLAIDEDGNAYVTEGFSSRYVKKYRAADGVLQWSTLGGDLLAYNKRLNAIFTTVNLYGKFNRVRQIDCVTGNVIANSAPIGSDDEWKAIDGIAVSRTGEFVYAAELQNYVDTHIFCFDSGDDFVDAEPIDGTYSVGDGLGRSLYLNGDPAGHYNWMLSGDPAVTAPEANLASGSYTTPLLIELSCSTLEAKIYYTIDGSEPDEGSSLYSDTIQLLSSTTIKARGYKEGYNPSDIATFTYTIASITDFTIKAKAFKSGLNPSDTVSFVYTKASLKDPTYQQVITTIKDIQLVSFNKNTNIAFLEALPNEGHTTGFYLIIQKIVKRLLTDKGSSSFDSTFGSSLCRLLGSSGLQDDVILQTNLTIILRELVEAINLEMENLEDDDVEVTDEMMLSSITVNSLRFDTNFMKWIITLKIVTLANEMANIQLGVG